jgi:hypothetical protein
VLSVLRFAAALPSSPPTPPKSVLGSPWHGPCLCWVIGQGSRLKVGTRNFEKFSQRETFFSSGRHHTQKWPACSATRRAVLSPRERRRPAPLLESDYPDTPSQRFRGACGVVGPSAAERVPPVWPQGPTCVLRGERVPRDCDMTIPKLICLHCAIE